jgi:acetyl esterase
LRIAGRAGTFHEATWHPHPSSDAPRVLHLHAGGFTRAPEAGHATVVERLLAQAGASILSLRYPLAPAHPFPQAVCAAYAGLRHLSRAGARTKAPLFVAGAEAGGNIAAGVAAMVRDRQVLPLSGQILFSPMLDPLMATAPQRDAHAGPAGSALAEAWRQYTRSPTDASHPYADPAHAVRLNGLAPAMLFTSADDPFRAETQAYAQRLEANGMSTRLVWLPVPTHFPGVYLDAAPDAAPWTIVAIDALCEFLAAARRPCSNPRLSP